MCFEGFVYDTDGAPAEGAVVVTSAGGQAITDWNGAYRLEALVPAEAEIVQITAVGPNGRNLRASASVQLAAAFWPTHVIPLYLAQGGTCSPSWLPTFGGQPGTSGSIGDLTVFDDGGGPALYAAGSFLSAGGVKANGIAKWEGSSWAALGSGMSGAVTP